MLLDLLRAGKIHPVVAERLPLTSSSTSLTAPPRARSTTRPSTARAIAYKIDNITRTILPNPQWRPNRGY